MKKILEIAFIFAIGFWIGWWERDARGWTATLPNMDIPKPKQIEACTTVWTTTQKIVRCKKYDEIRINE